MNSKTVGDRSVLSVIRALVFQGKKVSLPFGDNYRYDIVVDEGGGRFQRIQIKTGNVDKDKAIVKFPTKSTSVTSKITRKSYVGEIDAFGVYVEELDKVYIVPIGEIRSTCEASLRLLPPINNQSNYIKYAKDYEVSFIKRKELIDIEHLKRTRDSRKQYLSQKPKKITKEELSSLLQMHPISEISRIKHISEQYLRKVRKLYKF